MDLSQFEILNRPLLKHSLFWLFAFCLLTIIYGTAFRSYTLGIIVILLLAPVHMLYFYAIARFVFPRFVFPGQYIQAVFATVLLMLSIAILYRVTEIFVANPVIRDYYITRNIKISWPEIALPWWRQLILPTDFMNALERTNVIVWIGVSLKFVSLWYERRQAALRAELDSLRAQLHPHFLFNSLNNVYAFALDNSPRTPVTILRISSILRYMLYECSAEHVSLKKELEILDAYIKLEQIRYEERLELNFTVRGHVEDQTIAPLLMLPLLENAFKHGASETIGTPWINIDVLVSGKEFIFKVSNSKPENVAHQSTRSDSRIGLSNVKKRLELLYAGKHGFRIHDEEELFVAELKLKLS